MTTAESIAGTGTVGITSVLQSAQSPDATLRGQAEQHLQQLRENNHAQFVMSLAEELCEESKPIDTRRLAGLILKNELDARDEARKVSSAPTRTDARSLATRTERESRGSDFQPSFFCLFRNRTLWCKNGWSFRLS